MKQLTADIKIRAANNKQMTYKKIKHTKILQVILFY